MIALWILFALIAGFIFGFALGFFSGRAPASKQWTGRQS